ncbi:MAG: hypothetical protein WCJ64_02050 [Rhodospirillaceae bacterium]
MSDKNKQTLMLPKVQPIYPDQAEQMQSLRGSNAVHKTRVNLYTGEELANGEIIADPFTGMTGYPYNEKLLALRRIYRLMEMHLPETLQAQFREVSNLRRQGLTKEADQMAASIEVPPLP